MKKKSDDEKSKQAFIRYIARLYNLAHISILGSQGVIVFDCAPGVVNVQADVPQQSLSVLRIIQL